MVFAPGSAKGYVITLEKILLLPSLFGVCGSIRLLSILVVYELVKQQVLSQTLGEPAAFPKA